MPDRLSGSAALAAVILLSSSVIAFAEPALTTSSSPANSDTGQVTLPAPAPAGIALAMHAAYENAWAQRQAGDFEAAVTVTEAALREVNEALSHDPDMTTRRDLTEIRARLEGLRAASRHDLASAASAKASGNEPDEKVLNAPAIEGITPQINADVTRYIDFFTGAGRSTFERWLKRSGRYMSLFRSVLKKEGLPEDLVHLVFVESGFNLKARSVSAAVGPWQFLRSTGKLFGLTVNQWTDERKDPEKSTVAAARYLKHLYSIFGDWPLALASYNAGEGTVLRAIKKQGTTNYWDLRLPPQTEDYVPQFMAVLAISRDPEKYGFESVELDDPMEFDQVALKGAVDLRALARLADCSEDELRELNPAVLRRAAQGAGGITTVRVPRGKGEVLMEKLEQGAKLPAVELTLRHTVRRGESIQTIARTYHVSARQLALANGVGRKRPLRRGMVLTVPGSRSGPPARAELAAADPRASTAYVPPRAFGAVQSLGARSSAEGRMTLVVHRGETLASIAEEHGVSVDDVMLWNHLKSSHVRHGTRLKIRTSETQLASVEGDRSNDAPSAGEKKAESKKAESKSDDRDGKKSDDAHDAKKSDDARDAKKVEAGKSGDAHDAKPHEDASDAKRNDDHRDGKQDGDDHGSRKSDESRVASKDDRADAKSSDSKHDVATKRATNDDARGDAKLDRKKSGGSSVGTPRASRSLRATKRLAFGRLANKRIVVVVRQGDSLATIARRHGVTVVDLMRANRLRDGRVKAGQKLKLPVG
jgi:membrane-bound lytic murein transglycosylase D